MSEKAVEQSQTSVKKIAIEFDNTLIKPEVNIEDSEMLFGFKAFVMEQRMRDAELLITAHSKTDELVKEKMVYLESHRFLAPVEEGGLGFTREQIIFTVGNESQAKRLSELALTHLIDGDIALLEDAELPKTVQPLLLVEKRCQSWSTPCFSEWSELSSYFVWENGFRNKTNSRLKSIETISEEGDNFIYRLRTEDEMVFILKHYLADAGNARTRLDTEFNHLTALREVGLTNIPQPYGKEDSWAVYSYFKGDVNPNPTDDITRQLGQMLIELDNKGEELRRKPIKRAPDARLTLQSYVQILNEKWNAVLQSCQRPDGPKDIMLFMLTDFEQMRQDNLNHFHLICKREGFDKDVPLPEKKQIFSPTDFGLHNVLKTESGQLAFLDFESSGWDDPARLLADFFYSTDGTLTQAQKLKIIESFTQNRRWDKDFLSRFWAIADLVAVEWVLNILNVLVPEEMSRFQFLNPGVDPKKMIRKRFKKALRMQEEFQPMEYLYKHDLFLEKDTHL